MDKLKRSSIYYGVTYCKRDKVFIPRVTVEGKPYKLGYFKTDYDAAVIYDKFIRDNNLNKRLNFPDTEPDNDIPNTRLIRLTQGQFAIVDNDDYEYLNQFNWFANKSGNTYYAYRNIQTEKGNRMLQMHNVIMNVTDLFVDHKNLNGLHNYRSNLRPCTHQQNMANKMVCKNSVSSQYKGVSHRGSKYRVYVMTNGKNKWIGSFNTEIEAAKAYDKNVKELRGEFARLNFPE